MSTQPREEEPPKKSVKPIVRVVAGALVLLTVATAVATTITWPNTPDGPKDQVSSRPCDGWLKHRLRSTDDVRTANAVIAHIQDKRPEHCKPSNWNPVMTDIRKHDNGNLTARFARANGTANGEAITMPDDGAAQWTYDASKRTWVAHNQSTHAPSVEPPPTKAPTPTPHERLLGITIRPDSACKTLAVTRDFYTAVMNKEYYRAQLIIEGPECPHVPKDIPLKGPFDTKSVVVKGEHYENYLAELPDGRRLWFGDGHARWWREPVAQAKPTPAPTARPTQPKPQSTTKTVSPLAATLAPLIAPLPKVTPTRPPLIWLPPQATPTRTPTPKPPPRCTCVQHQSEAGTLFALDDTDSYYEAIYAIDMENGQDTRVGDIDTFGVEPESKVGGLQPLAIEWDGCQMWMIHLDSIVGGGQHNRHPGTGSDLYTVDMSAGQAIFVKRITSNENLGYIATIAWDGETMWGMSLFKGLVRIDLATGIATVIEPARHPSSASTGGYQSMTWADGTMYVANSKRIDVIDLKRAHLAERFFEQHPIRVQEDQIHIAVWANGRLHFLTGNYGFYAVSDDAEKIGKFVLMGPTDPFDGDRSGIPWKDFEWVPGDEGRCDAK